MKTTIITAMILGLVAMLSSCSKRDDEQLMVNVTFNDPTHLMSGSSAQYYDILIKGIKKDRVGELRITHEVISGGFHAETTIEKFSKTVSFESGQVILKKVYLGKVLSVEIEGERVNFHQEENPSLPQASDNGPIGFAKLQIIESDHTQKKSTLSLTGNNLGGSQSTLFVEHSQGIYSRDISSLPEETEKLIIAAFESIGTVHTVYIVKNGQKKEIDWEQ